MKVNKQREEIPNKLKQMSAQIDEMKMLTVKSSLKEQYETRIKHMDKIMEEARTEFDQADQSGKKDWSGFDQKIFRNLESFNRLTGRLVPCLADHRKGAVLWFILLTTLSLLKTLLFSRA